MSIERFPWLNDAIRAHQNIKFPSSTIIEGESGLAKKQLTKYFAQKFIVFSRICIFFEKIRFISAD